MRLFFFFVKSARVLWVRCCVVTLLYFFVFFFLFGFGGEDGVVRGSRHVPAQREAGRVRSARSRG